MTGHSLRQCNKVPISHVESCCHHYTTTVFSGGCLSFNRKRSVVVGLCFSPVSSTVLAVPRSQLRCSRMMQRSLSLDESFDLPLTKLKWERVIVHFSREKKRLLGGGKGRRERRCPGHQVCLSINSTLCLHLISASICFLLTQLPRRPGPKVIIDQDRNRHAQHRDPHTTACHPPTPS